MRIEGIAVWISGRTSEIAVRAGGIAGIGSGAYGNLVLRANPELVLGRSPFEMEAIYDGVAEACGGDPAGGLDIALWDLAAKLAGKPVCEVAGKPYRRRVPVHAYGSRFEDICVSPLPDSDLEGYAALRHERAVAVAAGATLTANALLRDMVQTKLVDIALQPMERCGITGIRRLGYYGWVFGVRIVPLAAASAVSLAAALHAAACFPPVTNAIAGPPAMVLAPAEAAGHDGMVPRCPGLGAGTLPQRAPDIVVGEWR